MSSTFKRKLRFAAVWFLGWTFFALFFFSQGIVQKYVTRDPTPWWHYLASWLVGVYLIAASTPAIAWLGVRFPLQRGRLPGSLAIHLILSLLFSVVQLATQSVFLSWWGLFPTVMPSYQHTFFFLMVIGFHQNAVTYWTILGVQYALRNYRKYQEREKDALRYELNASELRSELVRAQLNSLKMQLQPHFLFNTLNAIMVLVRQQKTRAAEETLALLSDLLRSVLENVEAQEVTLRRELEHLNLYLSIEQVRFQDRLQVQLSVDSTTLDAAVPHMVLQPIVENAIRHGIGRSSSASHVEIRAARVGETLEINVRDDGHGFAPEAPERTRGIGLPNTTARLSRLYGEEGQLTARNHPDRGAIVTLRIPFRAIRDQVEPAMMETHATHDAIG